MRILIQDINKDGKNDVITAKNHRLSELLSYRHFTHGEIEIRSWDGIGLAVLWRTRKLSGYISDFAIGDFDNDGQGRTGGSPGHQDRIRGDHNPEKRADCLCNCNSHGPSVNGLGIQDLRVQRARLWITPGRGCF